MIYTSTNKMIGYAKQLSCPADKSHLDMDHSSRKLRICPFCRQTFNYNQEKDEVLSHNTHSPTTAGSRDLTSGLRDTYYSMCNLGNKVVEDKNVNKFFACRAVSVVEEMRRDSTGGDPILDEDYDHLREIVWSTRHGCDEEKQFSIKLTGTLLRLMADNFVRREWLELTPDPDNRCKHSASTSQIFEELL